MTYPTDVGVPAPAVVGADTSARSFHGWRIVAVLAVTETISWGVLYYAYAVFQVPIGAQLGLSSAQLSGAFSLAVLATGVSAVGVGRCWTSAVRARS